MMKLRIKDSVEGRFMKKLLLTCILIASIIFITGCIGEEKTNTETSTSDQINQESDNQVPDLILKPNDVPKLTLTDYSFKAVSKSATYDLNNTDGSSYRDVLPLGMRNVGQGSEWEDESGRRVRVDISKFDSNLDSEAFSEAWDKQVDEYTNYVDQHPQEAKESALIMGNPNIGDASFYMSLGYNPDVEQNSLQFTHKNYVVGIEVVDEKDKSIKEAKRIAEIIKSRLD